MRLEWRFFQKIKQKQYFEINFRFAEGILHTKKATIRPLNNLIIFVSVVLEGAESLPDHVNGNGKNNDGKEGG